MATDASTAATHLLLEHLDTLPQTRSAGLLAIEGLRLDLLDLVGHGRDGGRDEEGTEEGA